MDSDAVYEIDSILEGFESFETFLEVFMNPSNKDSDGYELASKLFKRYLERHKGPFCLRLANVLNGSSSDELKIEVAKNIRDMFKQNEDCIQESILLAVQDHLFMSIRSEENKLLHDELAVTITEIGNKLNWNGFHQLLCEIFDSDCAKNQLAALSIISKVSSFDHDVLVSQSDSLFTFFLKTLRAAPTPSHRHIPMASIHAFVSFFDGLSSTDPHSYEHVFTEFQFLLPYVLRSLTEAIDSRQDKNLLKDLIEKLLRVAPRFLGGDLPGEVVSLKEKFLFSISEDSKSLKLLQPNNIDLFATLIFNTSSHIFNYNTRSLAVNHAQLLRQNHPGLFVLQLLEVICQCPDSRTKLLSLHLLNKHLIDIWQHLDGINCKLIKDKLLECWSANQEGIIFWEIRCVMRKIVVDIGDDYPGLFTFIFNWIDSNSTKLQEAGIDLLKYFDSHIVISNYPTLVTINGIFSQCLSTQSDLRVRIASFSAAVGFIICLSSFPEKNNFQNLIPSMMKTLEDASIRERNDLVNMGLLSFQELTKSELHLFSADIEIVFNTLLRISQKLSFMRSVQILLKENRRHAIKSLLVFAEEGLLIKISHISMGKVLGVLLNMCFEAEFETEDGSLHVYEKVTRFACSRSMTGKRLAWAANEVLCKYFASSDWRMRVTGIAAVVGISTGYLLDDLEYVVGLLVKAFRDDQCNVRFAAIDTIRQLRIKFGADFKARYRDHIIHILKYSGNGSQYASVQELVEQTMQLFLE